MQNIIKQNLATFMVTIFALSFFVGGVNVVAAADLGGFDDYGGFDYGYSDYGGFDYSYDDYGGFDYGYSFDDYGGFDYGNSYYEEGGYFPYEYSYEEGGYFPYEYSYEEGGYFPYDYDYYYDDYSYGNYDWGCGSYCGTGGGGSFDWGCGSFCGGYSTPSYSYPRYSVGAPSSSYSNVVTNTNTNVNNITNIDNSINDSFNNYNSGNTSIVVTAPQTPVYNPPVVHPAPYCTITHAQYGGYGSGAYLSWTSTNASSAYISGIGSVSISGSQTVYGGGTYTMTVYGYNGQTATCATTVQGTYVPPVYNPPYVSLTQIPYTGFDFGPIGNAMYWVSLLGFAAAGAYLMIYYRGGALAFATAMVPARKYQPVVAPKAPILVEKEAAMLSHDEVKVQPILASLKKSAAGTLDTMAIVQSKDGSMPKIVIQRA